MGTLLRVCLFLWVVLVLVLIPSAFGFKCVSCGDTPFSGYNPPCENYTKGDPAYEVDCSTELCSTNKKLLDDGEFVYLRCARSVLDAREIRPNCVSMGGIHLESCYCYSDLCNAPGNGGHPRHRLASIGVLILGRIGGQLWG